MLGFLTQLLHRSAVFVAKRRGALLLLLAILLCFATLSGLVALRPPFLGPAIDTVNGWFEGFLARPLEVMRTLTSPAPSQERLVSLELELARLQEVQKENIRLRDMLGYEHPHASSLTPAKVVALDLDPVRGVAWIDKGREHGAMAGQAIVVGGGLAGVIEEAAASRSRIRLLTNRDAPIGVRDTRSRVLGVLEWDPSAARLQMNFVPRQADVAAGDSLICSGLGGLLPAGLPVGRVESVEIDDHELLWHIRVNPFASFHTLEEVFIYQSKPLADGKRQSQ